MEIPVYIELSFRPNVEFISVVRRFVADFYTKVLPDADAISRVALATHELLENAVRYSTNGETAIRIEVDKRDAPTRLEIRTWNNSESPNLAVLEALFAESRSQPDSFAFYQAVMRKNATRESGSGLGLARIRAEADMSVSYEVGDGRVCIIAQADLSNHEAA